MEKKCSGFGCTVKKPSGLFYVVRRIRLARSSPGCKVRDRTSTPGARCVRSSSILTTRSLNGLDACPFKGTLVVLRMKSKPRRERLAATLGAARFYSEKTIGGCPLIESAAVHIQFMREAATVCGPANLARNYFAKAPSVVIYDDSCCARLRPSTGALSRIVV